MAVNSTSDAGQYACHVKFDVAEKFDTYFTVKVIGKLNLIYGYFALLISFIFFQSFNQEASSNILSEPTITTKIGDFGIQNGQIELYCSVKVASMMDRLEMKWELPNDNIAKKV